MHTAQYSVSPYRIGMIDTAFDHAHMKQVHCLYSVHDLDVNAIYLCVTLYCTHAGEIAKSVMTRSQRRGLSNYSKSILRPYSQISVVH